MEYFMEVSETIPKGVGFTQYGPVHIVWLLVFAVTAFLCCFFYRKGSPKRRKVMRYTLAALIVADELYKITFLLIGGNYSVKYLPLHLCSINIILIAIHAIKPFKTLDNYLYAIGIPAALMALLFPSWTKLPLLNFMHIHSFTVHILLCVYPLMVTVGGDIVPRLRDLPKCLALLLGMAIPVYFFNLIFKTNYMFLSSASKGNPLYLFKEWFGNHLWGYPILIPLVLFVMYAPYLLIKRKLDRKRAVAELRLPDTEVPEQEPSPEEKTVTE